MSHRLLNIALYLLMVIAVHGTSACGPYTDYPGDVPAPDRPMVEQVLYPSGIKGELQYNAARPGQTCVVLLHGPGYNREIWRIRTADAYKSQGRAVLLLDLIPGGDPDGATYAALSTDLHNIAGMLKQRFPVLLYHGVSTGGAIAIRAQADYRDAAGIIVQSVSPQAHNSGIKQTDQDALTAAPMVRVPSGVRALYVNPAASTPDLLIQDAVNLSADLPRGIARDMLRMYDDPAELHATSLSGNVLIQYGAEDKYLAPAGVWPPAVTVKTYPQIGHIFDLHRSDITAQAQADALSAAQTYAPVR